MNMIEQLAADLRDAYPMAKVKLDAPKRGDAPWWLDFSSGPNSAEIEWRPGHGFGISVNSPATFGDRSDEVHATIDAAFSRLKQLVNEGKNTEPPSELLLRTLRESRKMTQTQLAKLLHVKQASISKLESRADMHVSTLRNILGELGAELELRAVFSSGEVYVVQFKKEESGVRRNGVRNKRKSRQASAVKKVDPKRKSRRDSLSTRR